MQSSADLVYCERRIQVEKIARTFSVSQDSVPTKLTVCWAYKSFSVGQMATRAFKSSGLLKLFRPKRGYYLLYM